jgi:hypothetical protein
MVSIIPDTYEYASKLRAGGFTEQQAEAQTRGRGSCRTPLCSYSAARQGC